MLIYLQLRFIPTSAKVRQGRFIYQPIRWQEKRERITDMKGRLQKLRQKLVEKELDAIFISQPENRFYLSGFDGTAG